MSVVKINKFSGGLAEDVREKRTDSFANAHNFDVFNNDFLKPYRDTETETLSSGTIDAYKITDAVVNTSANTTSQKNIFFLGRAGSADENAKLFEKSTQLGATDDASSITSNIGITTSGEDTVNNVVPNTLVSYSKKLFFLATDASTQTYLRSYDRNTTTLSNIGTISDYPLNVSGTVIPRPFVHPKSGKMYIVCGGEIFSYDPINGLIANPILIPNAEEVVCTSMCDYGGYLAISIAPKNQGNPSKVILWDMTSSTVNDIIDFGEGALMILENLGGVIIGLSADSTGGSSPFSVSPRIVMRGYSGGTSQVLKSFNSTSIQLNNFKQKQNDKLFFVGKITVQGVETFQIFVCGKNKSGSWFLSPDRLVNGDTAVGDILGFNLIGDYLWAGYRTSSVNYLVRTNDASNFTATSIYESLVNHGMSEEDRGKKKQLKSVSVAKTSTTGQLVLKYRVDSQSSGDWVTICTLSSGGKLNRKEGREATGTPFNAGYEYQFRVESTNGAELVEVKYEYDVYKELI